MNNNEHLPVGAVIADYKRQIAELESQVKMLRGGNKVHEINVGVLHNELDQLRKELEKLHAYRNYLENDASDYRINVYLTGELAEERLKRDSLQVQLDQVRHDNTRYLDRIAELTQQCNKIYASEREVTLSLTQAEYAYEVERQIKDARISELEAEIASMSAQADNPPLPSKPVTSEPKIG